MTVTYHGTAEEIAEQLRQSKLNGRLTAVITRHSEAGKEDGALT